MLKKEINEAAKKFKVGGGGKYKYGPHKVMLEELLKDYW